MGKFVSKDNLSYFWQKIKSLLAGKADKSEIPTNTVKYSSQTLTDAQKTQARTNIGAGTSNFSGSYNDLSNKPTLFSGNYNDLTNKPTIPTGAAASKGVVTTVDTSANLPTSNAVKTFVEGKGYITSSGSITGNAATATNATKLNNQEPSYYLNYNNLSNKPTIPKLVTLTQAEYDALTTKDSNTYYFIKE